MKAPQVVLLTMSVFAALFATTYAEDPKQPSSSKYIDYDAKTGSQGRYLVNSSVYVSKKGSMILSPLQVGSCSFDHSQAITLQQWFHTPDVQEAAMHNSCTSYDEIMYTRTPDDAGFDDTERQYNCYEPGVFDSDTQMTPKDVNWWVGQLQDRCKDFGGKLEHFAKRNA